MSEIQHTNDQLFNTASQENQLEVVDMELRLLSGMPISAGDFEITPLLLDKIIRDGYTTYSYYLNLLCGNPSDLLKKKLPDHITIYDVVFKRKKELLPFFIQALAYFLDKEHFQLDAEYGLVFYNGDSIREGDAILINPKTYPSFVSALKVQNCVSAPSEEKEFNPSGERASAIIDKIKQAKEVVDKVKSNSSGASNITFSSIVSAVTVKSHHVSKFNFGQLTIYQLYDEYKRLQKITGYDVSVRAMVSGAKVEIEDWSTKMQ